MTRARDAAAALWLALLIAWALAGVALTPFHGDESTQIHSSIDYVTAFIERDPWLLSVTEQEDRSHAVTRRLLQGSVNPWAIGLAWQLAGYNVADLPPAPGWDWGRDYDANITMNMRPTQDKLLLSRLSSALMFAASIPVLFGIAWCFGGRLVAFLASGLYALHPTLLLNGRRAMMEGPLLLFGLLTIFCALLLMQRGLNARRRWWLALALAGGLALAAKHNGILFLGGALGWLWLTALLLRDRRQLLAATLRIALSGLLALAVFVMLSPALWSNPPERLQRLLETRNELLRVQVKNWQPDGLGMSAGERINQILTQPFLRPPQFFEVAQWSEYEVIAAEIDVYLASALAGLRPGGPGGAVLTLLLAGGLVLTLRQRRRAGLLVWLLLTLAAMMLNPLPWQRYYLPLLPLSSLLTALALAQVIVWIVRRTNITAEKHDSEQRH